MCDQFEQEMIAAIPNLRRFARVLIRRDKPAQDDLVQRALTRAWAKRASYEERAEAQAVGGERLGNKMVQWLGVILHNEYVNSCRRAARRPEGNLGSSDDGFAAMIGSHAAPDDPSVGLMVRDAARAIAKMTPDQQVVMRLIGFRGHDYQAVADYLGLPVGTVRSRLARGREALRNAMR